MTMVMVGLTAGAQSREEADSLHRRGRELLEQGKVAEGRECTRQAMEMRRRLLGEVNVDYITSLNNYAMSYAVGDDYPKAVELQRNVMELCDKLPEQHPNYGMYAFNMGRFSLVVEDYATAATYLERALPLVEKFGEIYEKILDWLGMVYQDLGDMDNLNRIFILTEEHNQHELTKPCDEPDCMLDRAKYYVAVGSSPQAKDCFLRLMAMPMTPEQKVEAYTEYARFLYTSGDYASAADYEYSVAGVCKEVDGAATATSVGHVYQSALYAYLGKQYMQSVERYREVLDFYKGHTGNAARKNEAKCQKGMGNAYSALKDHAAAASCYQKVVDYYAANDTTTADYPKEILRLAKAEKFNKDYDQSIAHHLRAMELFDRQGMVEEYADAANSLSMCYVYAGREAEVDTREEATQAVLDKKIDEILRSELESLEITRTYLGKLTYTGTLGTIAGCYAQKSDYGNAANYYEQYIAALREAVRDEFRLQSEDERMATWQRQLSNVDEMKDFIVNLPAGNDTLMPRLSSVLYDAVLLSKGILLNSSIEFEKVLAENADASLKDTYRQTQANEAEIERLRTTAKTDDDLQRLLSLMQQNQALQLSLYRSCAEYADFTDYIGYTWQDVRSALAPGDVAVEFAALGDDFFDESYMVAIVLTPDATSPVIVPICPLKHTNLLEGIPDFYETTLAGQYVWGPIANYLAGKKRIFFSPDGAFNRIAIEYLRLTADATLSEQYEVYRLSSTKELCMRRVAPDYQYAVLFGDINYNEAATLSAGTAGHLEAMRGSSDSEFANLDATKREISEITRLLSDGSIKEVATFVDTEASTGAFRSLDGSHVNLLHIATHGAYQAQRQSTDEQSMTRSLLAFAGANLSESAIVTAADIALMNLRQCDLAVLSACETGLGKLGDDGVFGLQRGFKNAGVRSLLMSLQNVYDNATADLMIAFYRNLLAGQSKRLALVNAQRQLRDDGFSDPKYWASFILLDALD